MTVITTLLLFVQLVPVTVCVTVYVVVTVGVTVGLAAVDVKPDGDEVQLYVEPATAAAPICVEEPRHTAALEPALAAGSVFTVTTTVFDFVQPVAVMVWVSV